MSLQTTEDYKAIAAGLTFPTSAHHQYSQVTTIRVKRPDKALN